MNFVVLGAGKTGALVAAVASERGHTVRVLRAADNTDARGLTPEALAGVDAVIDFTTPASVIENITACALAKKNVVVGTTGWYQYLPKVEELITATGTALVWAANFSVGVNLFMEVARAAASASAHGYTVEIVERHHAQKKDAPSGTALMLQKAMVEAGSVEPKITSIREGDVVGDHVIHLESEADSITLLHTAKSRLGFAQGAVRAAEWISGRQGLYNFADILPKL